MTDLTTSRIQDTYGRLMQIGNADGLDGALRRVQDGTGDNSALSLSTNAARVDGGLTVTGAASVGSLTTPALTLGSPLAAASVQATASLAGQVPRTMQGRSDESLNVRDFGAVGDSTTDDRAALLAMQTAVGRIVFPRGAFRVSSNATLTVPLFFEPGAALTLAAGVTLTVQGPEIVAPRQHIFQGAGVVRFAVASNLKTGGEFFPEWWGEFRGTTIDCSPILQAMSDACSLLTEWHATFITGARLNSAVSFGRGAFIQGLASTRRVVFLIGFTAGDVFRTTNVACRFEGIQFETDVTIGERTSGACIADDFGQSVIQDCSGNGYTVVRLGGSLSQAARISNVLGIGASNLAGASVVEVTGQACSVTGVIGGMANAGSAVVRVSGSASHSMVDNVLCITAGIGVDVLATGTTFMTNVQVSRVRMRDGGACGVRVRNEGSSSIWGTVVNGVTVGPAGTVGVLVENTSTGNIARTAISNVMCRVIAAGVHLNRAAGTLDRTTISDSGLNLATDPVLQTGTPTNVVIGSTVFV